MATVSTMSSGSVRPACTSTPRFSYCAKPPWLIRTA
jgi:hypothetical protein